MTVPCTWREDQPEGRMIKRAGFITGWERTVSKQHHASGAVFAQKTNWAKLSGESQMSTKARRQMQCFTCQLRMWESSFMMEKKIPGMFFESLKEGERGG